ncbi:LPXTG cell wall anchor domain-containing protein [Pseudolysinimonas sp.]|uniref:LPXTG cell wall anchor domain-containing protein n=1 Tax=Pseudolysinimonas sp. TaxID=2680009 RepID=UPI00378522A0
MPTPRSRRPFVRALTAAVAVGALVFGSALPAHAAPVVSEVAGGELVASLTEYGGLLYLGSENGLQSFDGTTFTTIPGAPESPRDFVEYLGDLWMVGGPVTNADAAELWRFDGTTLSQYTADGRDPVVVGGTLYFLSGAVGSELLTRTDGTTTVVEAGPPTDVKEIALAPTGDVALTVGTARVLWTFDGTAFTQVVQAGAPVNVDGLRTLSGVLAFDGQATAGDDDTAYTWDGTAFSQLGTADLVGCFVEDAGTLYYVGNDGSSRMFSATVSVAASEAPVTPTIPSGCPQFVASDGTLYLRAQGTGGNPTLHTWDGTTLTELDSVGDFPTGLVEYGGKIYFSAQATTETPSLFVLEDVTSTPTAPTLPATGAQVSWWLLAVAAVLLAGGAGILVVRGRRRA